MAELEAAHQELESFAYAVSHDLRAPLRAVLGFAQAIVEDAGDALDETTRRHLDRVVSAARRMNRLLEALLELSRLNREPLERTRVDVTALAREVGVELAERDPSRNVRFVVSEGLVAEADARLSRIVLDHLLGNAWKFTAHRDRASVEVGANDAGELFVRDDGVGFDLKRADRLFAPFQRFCDPAVFPGLGTGLATVLRILRRHGGAIRAEAAPGEGATFAFTFGPV